MNKLLITVLSIASFLGARAQNNFVIPSSLNQIIVNGFGGVGSSKIPQEFMNKFIFPDFINNDLKDLTSEKLSDKNLFGGEAGGSYNILINLSNDSKKKIKKFIGFGFGTQLEGNLYFTKDLFDLTFYGNKPFAGETKSLNETSFNALSYSYFEGTFGLTFAQNNGHSSIWTDISALVGHGYSKFEVGTGSFFTEETGDYLDVSLTESILEISDTSNSDFSQGIGGKTDINFAKKTDSYNLLFSLENIGGIYWDNTTQADLDTTFTFEGIEIGDIFQLSDSVLNEVASIDSLLEIRTENKFKSLPVNIVAYYKGEMEKFNFDVFIKHRLFTNYTPYLRAGFNFNLPVFKPGIVVAYGGYSTIQMGINTDIEIGKHIKLQLGTNNILGGLAPKTSTALDFYAGIRYTYKDKLIKRPN